METPKLDYWMLNIAIEALQEKYAKTMNTDGRMFAKQLQYVAEQYGVNEARKVEKEWQDNRFHALGAIWQSKRRLEEIRENISDNFQKVNNGTGSFSGKINEKTT